MLSLQHPDRHQPDGFAGEAGPEKSEGVNGHLNLALRFRAASQRFLDGLQDVGSVIARPALGADTRGNVFKNNELALDLPGEIGALLSDESIAVFAPFAFPEGCLRFAALIASDGSHIP